jgi:hypothetical protein
MACLAGVAIVTMLALVANHENGIDVLTVLGGGFVLLALVMNRLFKAEPLARDKP